MADEIVTRYKLDAEGWIKGAEQIDKGTDALIQDNKKLETSFGEVSKSTVKAFSADSAKNFQKEAGNALKDVKKETDNLTTSTKNSGNAFLKLKKDLKDVQGDLATLASRGREGSKLFKALSADAGKLKDNMADLGDAINLQGASPLENFTGSLGNAKNALLNLDIEGASRAFGIAGAQINKISFKELSGQIGQTIGAFGKLAVSIITNPMFLIAGAVAGIIAVIANWGDSLEEIRAKNDKLIAGIERRLSIVTTGYDAEIIKLQASGKATEEVEKAKLLAVIRATEQKIKLRQREFDFEIKQSALARKILGEDKFAEVVDASEINKELTSLRNELTLARAQFEAVDLKTEADANKKRDEENKKANDDAKKRLEERAKAQKDALEKMRADAYKAFQDGQALAKLELDAKIKQFEDERKELDKFNARNKQGLDQAQKDLLKIQKDIIDDETKSFEVRQETLDFAYRNRLITEEEYTAESQKLTDQRIAEQKRELDATVKLGNDLISIGESFLQIARNMGSENAEAEKAFAVFGVAVNLASSLANIILGATSAAAATGPLAPFTLVGYIASGTAAVLAAFAQVSSILSAEPPSFAHGGWTGDGSKFQPAGVVHKDEWVSTKEDTNKYWDELNAIHDGTFEDLLMYKYIKPALSAAIENKKSSDSSAFAENIANSLMLHSKFKDGNIISALVKSNSDEGKRHKQLLQTLKRTKSAYRKT